MNRKIQLIFILGFFSVALGFAQQPFASSKMELFGDHIFIKLRVDDSEPLNFIFDTGDGLPVLDMSIAKRLNLNINHKESHESAQGKVSGSLIKHNKIDMNGAHLEKDIKIYATDLTHLSMSIGRKVDGIIGYDLLHHYVVKLDYDNSKFLLYEKSSFTYTGNGEEFHFGLHYFIPMIKANVTLNNDESFEKPFFLNTGAGTAIDFNTPFATKNGMIEKTGNHYAYLTKGIGDVEAKHIEGRVKSFTFGKFTYNNIPVGISQAKNGIQNDNKTAGIIGNRLLSRYNIVFDYSSKAIYFEDRKNTEEFHVNACGFELQMNKSMSKYLVHRVYENTNGDKAGIKLNDVLVKVDGVDANTLSLPELSKKINVDGKTVKLTLSRNGKEFDVVLNLKELI